VTVRHLERIREALGEAGADALWIHPAIDFRYLTGLAPIAMERPTALVILGDGVRVLAPEMLAPELALDPGILSGLRVRKAPDELEHLRAAGREADAAMAWVAGAELDGRSERWLALELQMRFLRRGADPYDYVIAAGANAALPHHATGDTPIRADAPLLTDFGCVVGGYYSDMTRVHLPAQGGEAAEAYAIVRAAHDAVIAGLEPGLPCHDADRLARAVIEEAGFGERFVHRTGHGVGLEVHEEPYLRPGNPAPLEIGHVFSVEPGIYVPGRFGVRYENLVHLGADGPELLNAA
jgi:Xaa-Pro aminopeptidase